jgi:hypothetical protein
MSKTQPRATSARFQRWAHLDPGDHVRVEMEDGKIVSDQSLKKDAGKIPLELLSDLALDEIGKVLAFGAQKYAPDGWRRGMAWRRLIGAAKRHLGAFSRGEDKDPETGLPHLAHLLCCAMFLMEYQLTGNGTDDRWQGK